MLEEFGIRLVTYDLPGFGESDPHPNRNLESSALDMLYLANALGVNGKFWVVGHSGGSMHAWAALRYIPDRLAGKFVFSVFVSQLSLHLHSSILNFLFSCHLWIFIISYLVFSALDNKPE